MRRALPSAFALVTILGVSTPSLADPPPWAGVWFVDARGNGHGHGHHNKHDDDDDDYRVVYVDRPRVVERHVIHEFAGGPPIPVARGLPYGFNRGTCDRALISSEMMGGVAGGIVGGLAGSAIGQGSGRTAATIGGAIAGIMLGGAVGRGMDDVDQGCVGETLRHVPDHQAIAWRGHGGEKYRVAPVRSYQSGGDYCREYQAVAVIGGQRQQTYGAACMQPDGQWRIVE